MVTKLDKRINELSYKIIEVLINNEESKKDFQKLLDLTIEEKEQALSSQKQEFEKEIKELEEQKQ